MTTFSRLLQCAAAVVLLVAGPADAETRTYQRPDLRDLHPRHLAAQIDGALTRSGTQVDVAGLTVSVTHPALVAGDDPVIQALVTAYTFNADYGLMVESLALKGKVTVLRGWASDGEAVFGPGGTWDGLTTAQRFAVLKIMGDRLTKFFGSMADVLKVQGLD